MILLGFGLTLAATIAGLLPPLLTMPLVDNILSPYQEDWRSIEAKTEQDRPPGWRPLRRQRECGDDGVFPRRGSREDRF